MDRNNRYHIFHSRTTTYAPTGFLQLQAPLFWITSVHEWEINEAMKSTLLHKDQWKCEGLKITRKGRPIVYVKNHGKIKMQQNYKGGMKKIVCKFTRNRFLKKRMKSEHKLPHEAFVPLPSTASQSLARSASQAVIQVAQLSKLTISARNFVSVVIPVDARYLRIQKLKKTKT